MRVSMAEAISLLQQGEVVAIPTETVYGLAADARNEAALLKIYATKQRPASNPLIVHLADAKQVPEWASSFPPLAQRLAAAFWPGPLTLVLPARPTVSDTIRAQQPTVALRVPAHAMAKKIIADSGLALAAPSANKYTQLSPTTATHVEQSLGQAVPVLDGGACQIGIESTIISVSGNEWQLLRHGMISQEAIERITGKPALPLDFIRPSAPGQHLLHYSPRTPCVLFATRNEMCTFAQTHPRGVALLFGEPTDFPLHASTILPLNAEAAAEKLYAALHALDNMHAACIFIESPPADASWAAIHDRLQRASYEPTA